LTTWPGPSPRCPSRTARPTLGSRCSPSLISPRGDWPVGVAAAALALTAEDDSDVALGIRLLADQRDVFEDADRMHTEAILAAL
jgi:hypothetical protein